MNFVEVSLTGKPAKGLWGLTTRVAWVKMTLIMPILGSLPSNPEVFTEYLTKDYLDQLKKDAQKKKPEEVPALVAETEGERRTAEQSEALLRAEEEMLLADGMPNENEVKPTVFPRDPAGNLVIWDYQVKGMIKGNTKALIELGRFKKLNNWNYAGAIDRNLHIYPQVLPIMLNGKPITSATMNEDGKPVKTFRARPLRASTMQGERIAIAVSEQLPAGVAVYCQVVLFDYANDKAKTAELDLEAVSNAMGFGQVHGLLQWRGAGNGRFVAEEVQEKDVPDIYKK